MKGIGLLLFLCLSTNIFGQFSNETVFNDAFDRLNTEKYNEALTLFNSLITKDPNCADCYYGRAKTNYFLKKYKSAIIDCEKSLIGTKDLQANYSLLGDIKYKTNDYAGSVAAYEKALSIQKEENDNRTDGKEILIETKYYEISKLKSEAIKNNRPQLGNFNLNISFFDKVITQKLTVDDFYRHIYDYLESWESKKYEEFNELTGEHDLLVNSPEILLNYKGSRIYLTLKSLNDDTNAIYYIQVGLNCKCEWFNIKNEATTNGYKQYEYSDNPDNRNSMFGGLDIKYKKGNKTLIYNKFHSKVYSDFSLSQEFPKPKKPTKSDEYLQLAKVKYKSSKVMEAMENVNKAIELDKNNSDAYFFKGLIYFDNIEGNKEFSEGSQTWATMDEFNKAISINSKNPEYFLKRASLYNLINQKEDAILDLQKVSELQPTNSQTLRELANILIDSEEYSNALQVLDTLIIKITDDAQLFLERAMLKNKMGDKNGACSDYKKAEKLGFSKSGRLDLIELIQKCR
ncbi:tetratricopeptide repeat protein [Gelidibacter salicanalis]|uniref:Tetratricopeptide repeat protein n=1 Tax=Gelidibacter salicanalis TaxID=291193 RepID=A0A934KKW0_9FLAO|nr:tetratricopeptide repeat protein [Gelidibacter salicanalis]MBJ7880987.1 tetratricopeptide repeat protein [Gelidibacter salicanalis]